MRMLNDAARDELLRQAGREKPIRSIIVTDIIWEDTLAEDNRYRWILITPATWKILSQYFATGDPSLSELRQIEVIHDNGIALRVLMDSDITTGMTGFDMLLGMFVGEKAHGEDAEDIQDR